MHWFSYLSSPANPRPPSPPPLVPITPVPPVSPTLSDKYFGDPMPGEISDVLKAEVTRLVHALNNPAQATRMQGWTLSTSNCSQSVPLIMVCKESNAAGLKTIKIAPVLLDSILLEAGTPTLLTFQDRLKQWGADPQIFDGTYQASYAQSGKTSEDWYAVLGALGSALWPKIIGSIDFVIAQQMASIYLSNGVPLASSSAQVNQEAKSLATAANGAYDPSLLITVLTKASAKYNNTPWGYETLNDLNLIVPAIPPP